VTAINPEYTSADLIDLETVFVPKSARSVAGDLPSDLCPKQPRRWRWGL